VKIIGDITAQISLINMLKSMDNFSRCCQTKDCKHQIDGAIEIYALNS